MRWNDEPRASRRDFDAWHAAVDAQARMTRETTIALMQGEMYHSRPIFNPSLPGRYRLSR